MLSTSIETASIIMCAEWTEDLNLTVAPAAVIQVYPLAVESHSILQPSLSTPYVKMFLYRLQGLDSHSLIFGSMSKIGVLWDDQALPITHSSSVILHGSLYNDSSSDGRDLNIHDLLTQTQDQVKNQKQNLTTVPIIYIPSEDPTTMTGVPCLVRIHSSVWNSADSKSGRPWATDQYNTVNTRMKHNENKISRTFAINDATMVYICPPIQTHTIESAVAIVETLQGKTPPRYIPFHSLHHHIMGEIDIILRPSLNVDAKSLEEKSNAIFSCYDQETIQSLTLRMSMLLSRTVYIGTTSDAFHHFNRKLQQRNQVEKSLRIFWKNKISSIDLLEEPTVDSSYSHSKIMDPTHSMQTHKLSSLINYGAVTVHDPYPASGKTTLVTTIAQTILHCDHIHIIHGAAFFAKYGANAADSALETLIHSLILSSAVNGDQSSGNVGSICIILDHLDSFVPSRILGRESGGSNDPFNPTLTSMSSYLSQFAQSIEQKCRVPFPSKNILYNYKGQGGIVLPIRLCLVGIVTCDDGIGRKGGNSSINNILNILGDNRFRLTDPSSAARLEAYRRAFASRNISLSEECQTALPILAAKANRARGSTFIRTADALKCITDEDNVSLQTLEKVIYQCLDLGSDPSQIPSNVSFHINTAPKSEEKMVDNFSSVGGNLAAKRALVEALALDPRKRRLMASCGMSAPTGVLLYGPPGTGKTLLARATAESMQKATEIGLSGAFISIRASDIILSDIGGSEKLLVETFETARRNSPSVVFIDEFEAIFNCPSDGGGTRGTSRLANTLLQCMDDVKRWRDADFAAIATEGKSSESSHGLNTSFSDIKGRVVILAATNAPWSVDKAFLRPGRFSKVVYVGLPTVEEREMIIKGIVGKMKLHLDDSASRMETVCTIAERIAADSDGFSGADLVGLCRAAAVLCLHEHGSDARYSGVAYHHFAMALKNTRPSCDPSLVNRLQRWRVNDRNR